jgi:tetratricopeptide (TPR) repeat protein
MKRTRNVTAVLLLAAFAAVGCSKRGETPQAKTASPDAAQEPVPAPGASKPTDGEGFVADATPKITGPVSFADGETAYQAKKYADAAAIFESYTERRPGNAWGHYMLALSAWKSGDLAKSEGAFEKALSIDPNHFKSLVNLSRVLIEQKRFDDAIVTLTHAEGVDADSIDVQRLLARVYHAQGKTDEAEAAYRRALELNERDAWSMNNLGLVLLEAKRADEALPLLVKAVELRKDVPEFHNNLGMALEHTGRFKAAATAYGDALSANPGYDKAKQNLARVEVVKGGAEEPFKVEGAPKGSIAEAEIPVDEKTASK